MNGDNGRLLADIRFSSLRSGEQHYLRFVRCTAYQMPHEFPGNLEAGNRDAGTGVRAVLAGERRVRNRCSAPLFPNRRSGWVRDPWDHRIPWVSWVVRYPATGREAWRAAATAAGHSCSSIFSCWKGWWWSAIPVPLVEGDTRGVAENCPCGGVSPGLQSRDIMPLMALERNEPPQPQGPCLRCQALHPW